MAISIDARCCARRRSAGLVVFHVDCRRSCDSAPLIYGSQAQEMEIVRVGAASGSTVGSGTGDPKEDRGSA